MTRWSTLHRIPTETLDKKTAPVAAALNERMDAIEAERQHADKMKSDFLGADPGDTAQPGLHWDGYDQLLRSARAKCLTLELALREDLAAFLDGPRREAMTAAANQADAAHEKARQQIEKGLLALGYDPRDPWLNGMIERHPHVHEAREAARAARAHAADRNLIVANKAAIDQVRAEIDQRRAAAVA